MQKTFGMTDALRWQRFDDVLYAFFDLERLFSMMDSNLYKTEDRHFRKYIVISLVTVIEQFCREMVKAQINEIPSMLPRKRFFDAKSYKMISEDELRNFQNTKSITETLNRYGISGIFDGEEGSELRTCIDELVSERHDAVHTVTYTMFDVSAGHLAVERLFRRILDLSVFGNSSNFDIAKAGYEINNNNRDRAVKIMRDVVGMADRSHNVMYNKGIAWRRLGKYEMAIECLNKAIEMDPDDHKIPKQMGFVFAMMGNHEEKIKCFSRALQLEQNNITTLANLCMALIEAGYDAEAVPHVKKIEQMRLEDPLDIFYKGVVLGSTNQDEKALECFEEALARKSNDPDATLYKGIALGNMGLHEEALDCFDATLKIWHDNPRVLSYKATALDRLGRHQEAKECRRMASGSGLPNQPGP